MTQPKALLLSGYHSISQKYWANFVIENTPYDWHQIALPPRYFSWRMRGAPLSVAALCNEKISANYDLLLATSSIDLSVIQSIYPNLRNTPSILYFHENQFAYPEQNTPGPVVDWQMVNLYSALRADKLLFNTEFNRSSFLTGARRLLKKMPDLVPKNLIENLANKSSILPVPVPAPDKAEIDQSSGKKPLKILWNHRWEWDKNPELLLCIFRQADALKLPVKFILTGQKFRTIPEALMTICEQYQHLLELNEFIEEVADYRAILAQANIVLSTANHEFQGVAVMEAVSEGCVPLLPNRLSYPDIFSTDYLYASTGSNEKQALAALKKLNHWLQYGLPKTPDLSEYFESNLVNRYSAALTL